MRVRGTVLDGTSQVVGWGGTADADGLDAARARWRAAGVSDYVMHVAVEGCPMRLAGRFHVTVLDGVVKRVARTDVRPTIEMGPVLGFAVEDQFALVAEAIERSHAHTVVYDRHLGHPTALDVTWAPTGPQGPGRYRARLAPIG